MYLRAISSFLCYEFWGGSYLEELIHGGDHFWNWVWFELVLRVDCIRVFWGLANLKLSCLAQSVECWTSITEDKSSNPWQAIQARLSAGFLFVTAKGVSITTLTGMIFFTVLLPVWWIFFFTTIAFWYNNKFYRFTLFLIRNSDTMIVPAPLPHIVRISKRFFGIQDFPYLKFGIQEWNYVQEVGCQK